MYFLKIYGFLLEIHMFFYYVFKAVFLGMFLVLLGAGNNPKM